MASPAAEEDVAGLFNHNHNMPLGMRSAGTVSLFEDDIGLGYEIDPPDTQAGRDLVTNLRRKDVKGSSLSFFVAGPHARRGKVVWAEEHVEGRGAVMVREIHSATVLDVGPATIPAYSGTSSGLRSRWEGQGREHLLAEAAAACRRRGPGLEELDMRVRLAQLECEHRTRRADSLL